MRGSSFISGRACVTSSSGITSAKGSGRYVGTGVAVVKGSSSGVSGCWSIFISVVPESPATNSVDCVMRDAGFQPS